MNELKINEVGMVAGKLVKCVECVKLNNLLKHGSCAKCLFNNDFTSFCINVNCLPCDREDVEDVMFIPPTPAEVEEYQRKEGEK